MKVEFAFQCGVQWDDMSGGDRVRHCESCDHAVYDISQMTRSEARKFLERTNGDSCVSFMCDEDGEVITRPERSGRGVRSKLSAAALTLPLLLAGCDSAEPETAVPTAAPAVPTAPEPEDSNPTPVVEASTLIAAARNTANKTSEELCDYLSKPKQHKRRLGGKPRRSSADSSASKPKKDAPTEVFETF